nr:hypothetical protein [Levilactobacillus brevis]
MGANDFAETWYSYDESDGDYALDDFSVAHDEQTLVPYIRNAQRYQQIWNYLPVRGHRRLG